MSHLIEEYAKNLGVKISKPIVSKHFWPLTHTDYITICAESGVPSRQYKYYELVIYLLKPHLEKLGIKIFQVGTNPSTKISNVDGAFLDLPFKNLAYIISKSKLHIGSDEVYSHYASSVDVPLITLFGHIYGNISKGYWGKNQTVLEAPWKVKPCFNMQDPEDAVNKINPEEVAQAVINQLKLSVPINLKTKYIGSFFDKKIIEVVPNFFSPINGLDKEHVFMRTDFGFEEESFIQWCKYLSSFTLFLDKLIDPLVLSQIKSKLKNISIVLEDDETFTEEYLNSLRKLNVQINLLVKDSKKISYYRNKFFDFSVDVYFKSSKKDLPEDFDFKNCFFLSSKSIFANNNIYPSKYHMDQANNVDKSMKLVDNDDLLEELIHFYIYERK